MTGGAHRREAEGHGLAQMSTARSNRQAVSFAGGEARESSDTPELGQVENGGSTEKGQDMEKGTCTGSGPSGMETERGGNFNEQGCVGSNEEPKQDGLAVFEVARTVAKTGLEDGRKQGATELLQQPKGDAQAERRAPPKVYMLESSDEDEADVDDEEGEGLDEIDDLDGSWQTTLPAKHLRVLLVEDDDCTRHVVSALLRNCGYEVTPAADGYQALKLLSDGYKQFDLVLTEVLMPALSGIQLLSRIQQRDQHQRMPVIMMSSKDTTDVVFKCFQRGAADFLVKPVRKNELKNLWQHVWRRCKSSSGSGSGGSGTNAAAKKAPRKVRGRVRDGSGDRSGSGSDSAGGQINAGGNGSDNGSGTRNESSPVPDRKLEAAETSTPLEDKPEEAQRDVMPERGAEDFLSGMKPQDVSTREPMRERGGDAQAGEMKKLEASPSRDSGKVEDLIGNFVGDEEAVNTPRAMGKPNNQQAERGSEGAAPGLELSLKRSRPNGDLLEDAQPPSKQQLRTLRQSGGSAFSRYSMGGALTNSSRQSQNQPQPGGYSSQPVGPPHNGGSTMNSFMPEFQIPSAFQMPSHLLPPDFSAPRTVEAGPEHQGPPPRHNSGEISSAAKRPNGSTNEQAGPPPPPMKEEYPAGPMRPSSMAIPPQGFLPPGFSDPGFGPPFPPQFGYYFPQGTAQSWMANQRKEPPNPSLPPSQPQTSNKEWSEPQTSNKNANPNRPPDKEVNIHHHHHHHHHTHHHDANQRHHDVTQRHPKHHKVSHPQAARASEAPGGSEPGLAGSSRQEIAQSRKEQAGKVAAHLDRADLMEKRDSQRQEALDNSGDDNNANGNSSGANNTSGGGSHFGSNGRSSLTPGSGATTEAGTGTGASNTGGENLAAPSHLTPGNANEMAIDGVDEVDKSARREAALNKFRQKRKERNFEKKVRYQSRKRLAEQRPRIRGQFVRQTTFPNAVQQFVRAGSQGESL